MTHAVLCGWGGMGCYGNGIFGGEHSTLDLWWVENTPQVVELYARWSILWVCAKNPHVYYRLQYSPPASYIVPIPPMKSLSFSCFKVSLYMYKTKQRITFSNHSKLGIVKDSNLVAAVPRMKERNPSWRLTSPFVFWFLRPKDVEIPCNYRNNRTLGACMSCCSWLLVIINHNSSCIRTNRILTE